MTGRVFFGAVVVGVLASAAPAAPPPPRQTQEAPPGVALLSDLQRIQAQACIEAFFAASTEAGRATALARAEASWPLAASDAASLLESVRSALPRFGSRYDVAAEVDGKGEGTITLAAFPELTGRFICAGRRGGHAVPLFIGLHGGGATGGDGTRAERVFRDVPANSVQVYPTAMQLEADAWNTPREEQYVLALIAQMIRTFDIDTNRIYLAGTSMGGFGAWSMGTAFPDRFAALASGAGGVIPMRRQGRFEVQPGWVENLFGLPIWFYHSVDDARVPPHGDRAAGTALKRLHGQFPKGYEYVYKEYLDRGHGAPPLGHRPILQWMFARTRDPAPPRVRWRPCRSYKRQCYWLYWPAPKLDGLPRSTTGPLIDAHVTGPNAITVTGAPAGLEILLRPGFVDLAKPVTLTVDGRVVFEAIVRPTLKAMLLAAGESRDPELVFTARVPLPPKPLPK